MTFRPDHGSPDQNLDALFQAYREACPTPDPNPNFMPQLWQRIEARQRTGLWFGRLAKAFITAAVAASVVMAVLVTQPHHGSVFSAGSYVEVLANTPVADAGDFYEPVHLDTTTAEQQPVNFNLDEL